MDAPVSGTKDGRDSIDPSGGQLEIGVLPVFDQLCGLCQTLRDDGFRYLLSTAPKDEAEAGRTVAHHASLSDLLRSASQGCKLCRTFYDASVVKNDKGGGTTSKQWIGQTDAKAARNGYDVSVVWVPCRVDRIETGPVFLCRSTHARGEDISGHRIIFTVAGGSSRSDSSPLRPLLRTRWVEEYRSAPEKAFSAFTLSKKCLYKSKPVEQYHSCYDLWHHIVEDYSACRLSAGDDVLPALLSVANVFSRIAHDTQNDQRGRDGQPRPGIRGRRGRGPRVDTPMCDFFKHTTVATRESLQYGVEVLGVDVRPAGEDAYGRVATAVLSLRGPLMRCRLRLRCREVGGCTELLAIYGEDSGLLARGWADSNARYGDWSCTSDAIRSDDTAPCCAEQGESSDTVWCLFALHQHGLDRLLSQWAGSGDLAVDHHHSLAELQQSALAGCKLCSTFYRGIMTWNHHSSSAGLVQWVEGVDRACSSKPFQIKVDWDWTDDRDARDFWRTAHKVVYYRHQAFKVGHDATLRTKVELRSGRPGPYSIGHRPLTAEVDWCRLKSWILSCLEDHGPCRSSSDTELPSRVLDLTHASEMKLLESHGQCADYVTLSHRWGDSAVKFTTKATLASNLRGIHYTSLPKTFQDAVTATRRLGYRYLWIDSVCIIQDDKEDWHRQCAAMKHIYANSILTIACPAAADSFEGFLHPRVVGRPDFKIDIGSSFSAEGSADLEFHLDPSPLSTHISRSSALDARAKQEHETIDQLRYRGWFMQERLLSRRIISFGRIQAKFECNCVECFETYRPVLVDGPTHWRLPKNCLSDHRSGVKQISWYDIVEAYSNCHLSYGDDILPALSGIAGVFSSRNKGKYVAGLWDFDLLRGLCWRRNQSDSVIARRPLATHHPPPSWSWAACRYPVEFPVQDDRVESDGFDFRLDAQVMNVEAYAVGVDPYGQVGRGVLRLRARLRHSFFRYQLTPSLFLEEIYDERGTLLFTGRTSFSTSQARAGAEGVPHNVGRLSMRTTLTLDEGRSSDGSVSSDLEDSVDEVWCLFLDSWTALVLKPVPGRPQTFARVGLLSSYDVVEWGAGAPITKATLV
ncbi:hypothetical protein LTR53_011279 [Teratosphaeriaceae sp. CCFEE 6253]|nr:hypothetical protein LTR53_011279 [Teratosphaeriaceae sp. CCFEE 6253]